MKHKQKYVYSKYQDISEIFATSIFEQCIFCSRYSYFWVTYLHKSFLIFPGVFPTRFVGNNLWEIPPKKAYGNLFQNIFKELFVDIFPRNIIQHFLVVFFKDTPQEIMGSGNLFGKSLLDPWGDICHEKNPAISRRYPAQRQKHVLGDIPQDTALILKILCERYGRKKEFKKHWRKEFSNISLKKLFWETIPKNVINQLPNRVRNIF